MLKKKDENEQLVTPGESKCIWVEAGILSYKLCTSKNNCNSCPFNHVMLEIVKKEEKASRRIELKNNRRKMDRREKEDTSLIEEFKRLPAS